MVFSVWKVLSGQGPFLRPQSTLATKTSFDRCFWQGLVFLDFQM